MWYSNHRKADRIVRKPEYIYHATNHDFKHPIIDPSESASKTLGFGGDAKGEGFYNTKDKDVHGDYAKQTKYTRKYKLPHGFRLLTYEIPGEEVEDIIDKINAKFFNNSLKIDDTHIREMTYHGLEIIVDQLSYGKLPTTLNNMLYHIGYDGLEYPPYTNFAKPKDKTKFEPNILVWNHDAINNPRKFVRERHLGTEDYDNNKLQAAIENKKATSDAIRHLSYLTEYELVDLIKNNYRYLGGTDFSGYQSYIQDQLLKRMFYTFFNSSYGFYGEEGEDEVKKIAEIIKNNYQLDHNGVIIDLSFKAGWLEDVLADYIFEKIKHSPEELAKAILNDGIYNFQGANVNLEKYSKLDDELKEVLKKQFEQNPLELENLKANNFKYVYNGVEIQYDGMHDFNIPRGKL